MLLQELPCTIEVITILEKVLDVLKVLSTIFNSDWKMGQGVDGAGQSCYTCGVCWMVVTGCQLVPGHFLLVQSA
jgi:hypothetical protein